MSGELFLLLLTCPAALLAPSDGGRTSEGTADLNCTGLAHRNVALTAYYPDYGSDDETDYLDAGGRLPSTLQDFLDGRTDFVTVGVDSLPEAAYGTPLCSPELNRRFGKEIRMQVRDRRGTDPRGGALSRLEICVRSEADSYDRAVNGAVTVHVGSPPLR